MLVVSLGLSSGVLAFARGDNSQQVTTVNRQQATTTTTAAPVVTPPPTAPPTTAAPAPKPAPVRVAPPTTARPRTTTTAPHVAAQAAPTGTYEQRGEQALALINYPWQQLGYSVTFEPGRTGLLGLTDEGTRVITIYVRDSESMDTLTRTIAHELGHALDFSRMTDSDHSQYIAIRGINATPDTWFGCNACEDYSTAAGDWAETFQYWLLGPGQYFSKMGPPPDAGQLAQLNAIFTIH